MVTRPGWVTEIHQAYAAAGADVIKSHTFGANRIRLREHGLADRVRELNFRAVRLVRDVREVSGRALFIAGDVGPLGARLQPAGPLAEQEVRAAFHEQVSVLWEAGADLLLFETFVDLAELEIAVQVARQVCDLPVVASMTFAEDGLTVDGLTPEAVAARLQVAGVDVLGVNCSVGPAAMLVTLQRMHAAAPEMLVSGMPNAGFPERVEGRLYYPASPEYFGRQVAEFVAHGASLVGGCCGTTPMHIRAMRTALDGYLAEEGHTPAADVTVVDEAAPSARTDYGVQEDEQPTELLRKLRAGKFVISVEVDPPRSFNAEKQIEGARYAKAMGADAVNVADSPMARVRMSALALCVQIQQQVGVEIHRALHHPRPLPHGLAGGPHRGTGIGRAQHPGADRRPAQPGRQQAEHASLRRRQHRPRAHHRPFQPGAGSGRAGAGQKGGFTVAVACDPTRADLAHEVDRFHHKVSGGAHFTMTQPIFAAQLWADFVRLYEERHGRFPVPVLIGVLPLQGHKHASFLHNEVPGITLSEEALERMRRAGPQGRQEGVKMAQELLLELKELPYVQGVYLMPSFGRYETACEVLEVLSPAERGVAIA